MEDKKIIGIDLGGTSVKFAVVSTEGDLLDKWTILTDISDEGTHITPSIIESLLTYMSDHGYSAKDFIGIGMGSPGTVDRHEGTVIGAYNLNWATKQPVRKQIEEATGIPFFIDNDANVAALGEQWIGAGHNEPNVVFVTLGTGVGGGVIMNNQLLHGAIGAAGEIGHMTVDREGYKCTCGKNGCLETVASATGVVRVAKDRAAQFQDRSLIKDKILAGETVDTKMIMDAAKEGDMFALLVVDEISDYLGLACGNIANLLNPSTIVIGGGVSKAGEFLAEKIRERFTVYAFPTIRQSTNIRIAELGNDAGVIGASSLVLNESVYKHISE
ncbi:MAG: ROK family glucokinase [Alkalibacterium sp.]|nr:ROK family glucokinase [Alkalibacterium sp.]